MILDAPEQIHKAACPAAPRAPVRLERLPKRSPLKWVPATGSPATRHRKAAMYLKAFPYKEARRFDTAEQMLAKVVCNLRHYYRQSREETLRLVQDLYLPRVDTAWSAESIGLTWDLVEPFTPSLGLEDPRACRMREAWARSSKRLEACAPRSRHPEWGHVYP